MREISVPPLVTVPPETNVTDLVLRQAAKASNPALFSRLEVTSFAFEVEILLRAQAAGSRVRRQPLHLLNDEDSSVRLTRHAPRMLLDVLRIAVNNRRGRYDRHA